MQCFNESSMWLFQSELVLYRSRLCQQKIPMKYDDTVSNTKNVEIEIERKAFYHFHIENIFFSIYSTAAP